MTQAVIINSPNDAFVLLKQLLEDKNKNSTYEVDIGNLPPLEIYLKGDKFDNSLTTGVMHGLIDLQNSIYRSYALLKHGGTDLRLLKDYEKEALELKVVVKKGSSDLEVDTDNLVNKLVELMGKMESKHILVSICVITLALFGYGVTSRYFDFKTEQVNAEKETKAEEERTKQLLGTQENTIKAIEKGAEIAKPSSSKADSAVAPASNTKAEALPQQDTNYFKLISPPKEEVEKTIAKARMKDPTVKAISNIVDDGVLKLIKSTENADLVRFNNFFESSGDVARKIAEKPRSSSSDIAFNGQFRVLDLDSARTDKRKVKLRQVSEDNPMEFTAEFTDNSIGKEKMDKIMQAIRGYHPIELGLTAKVLHDKVHSAIITQVREIDTTFSFKDEEEDEIEKT